MSFPSPLAPLIASAARFPNINKEEERDPFAPEDWVDYGAARFPNINKEEERDPFGLDFAGTREIMAQLAPPAALPAAPAEEAAAAPAPAAPAPPWRPLQQRTMVNPEREAERKRKEALRGALQQRQQGPTQLSGEGSRRYINPEREAQRTSGKFGG